MVTRFLAAQDKVYPQVLQQLRAGRKDTHWMWFIFPQLAGLGHSDMARHYALQGLAEAGAYAAHPVLGARLLETTRAVLLHAPDGMAPRALHAIFGAPDDLKFISSMTLFARAVPGEPLFARALDAFNSGAEDPRTLALLGATGG
ncbi:calpastatin [Devosia chinhatensis]|uniref:Calpastatin n=2 Tax=Devosia chinhatensis TaxID=429727 RepID=A0A0F5FHJ6_9HYPH|nr:calpastatin [Devosia chinhatensis]